MKRRCKAKSPNRNPSRDCDAIEEQARVSRGHLPGYPRLKAKLYQDQHEEYARTGMTQLSMRILRRMLKDICDPSNPGQREMMLRALSKTAKEFLLNEHELIVWSIYLDRFVWPNRSSSLETGLRYSAYAAKVYMNSDVSAIATHFNSTQSAFNNDYEKWLKNKQGLLDTTPQEMNQKLKLMTKTLDVQANINIVNYNDYVDSLLKASDISLSPVHDQFSDESSQPGYFPQGLSPVLDENQEMSTLNTETCFTSAAQPGPMEPWDYPNYNMMTAALTMFNTMYNPMMQYYPSAQFIYPTALVSSTNEIDCQGKISSIEPKNFNMNLPAKPSSEACRKIETQVSRTSTANSESLDLN